MADRTVYQTADIYAHIPTEEVVTVTVVNPINQVIVDAQEATPLLEGRFHYRVHNVTMTGLWQAVWEYSAEENEPSTQVITPFTVGPEDVASMTKFEVRAAVAQRTAETIEGEVFEALGHDFIDPRVVGGSGNYVKWWLLVNTRSIISPRRIHSFSGSGFVVQPEFEAPVMQGTPYIMMNESPYAIDRAVEQAISEVSDTARIQVHVPNIPIGEGGTIIVPRGLRDIHQVLLGDGTEIPFNKWNTRSGRRLIIQGAGNAEFAQVIGTRPAGIPRWEDSRLDYDSGTIVARAASLIHAKNARGQGRDMNEHLRRQLAAYDEFEVGRRRASGRPYAGSRTVVD